MGDLALAMTLVERARAALPAATVAIVRPDPVAHNTACPVLIVKEEA